MKIMSKLEQTARMTGSFFREKPLSIIIIIWFSLIESSSTPSATSAGGGRWTSTTTENTKQLEAIAPEG